MNKERLIKLKIENQKIRDAVRGLEIPREFKKGKGGIKIILDACRYDIFKKVYKKYFDSGVLKKKIGKSTRTKQWLFENFSNGTYKDIIYISGNPLINSKIPAYYKGRKINCRKKFFKVIDTWDWGWNEEFGTIFPEKVNEDFFKYYSEYPDKNFIVHYMQPHLPYIPLLKRDKDIRGSPSKTASFFMFDKPILHKILHFRLIRHFTKKIRNLFYKVKKLPIGDYQRLIEKYDPQDIKIFYKENLEYVLKHVSIIVKNVDSPIIITSDHGELLGEYGLFGHDTTQKYKELVEIPIFHIIN